MIDKQELTVLEQKWKLTKPIPSNMVKFTPRTVALICENLANGSYLQEAVKAAGIGGTAFKRWRSLAEEDPDSVFAEFMDLVETARAQAELSLLSVIKTASDEPKNWTAAAWLLERSRPERWSLRNKVDHGGEIQHKIVFEFVKAKPHGDTESDPAND